MLLILEQRKSTVNRKLWPARLTGSQTPAPHLGPCHQQLWELGLENMSLFRSFSSCKISYSVVLEFCSFGFKYKWFFPNTSMWY